MVVVHLHGQEARQAVVTGASAGRYDVEWGRGGVLKQAVVKDADVTSVVRAAFRTAGRDFLRPGTPVVWDTATPRQGTLRRYVGATGLELEPADGGVLIVAESEITECGTLRRKVKTKAAPGPSRAVPTQRGPVVAHRVVRARVVSSAPVRRRPLMELLPAGTAVTFPTSSGRRRGTVLRTVGAAEVVVEFATPAGDVLRRTMLRHRLEVVPPQPGSASTAQAPDAPRMVRPVRARDDR